MAECYTCTDVGRVRPSNEDSVLFLPEGACLVADGMGGAAAGEVASSLLAQTVAELLREAAHPWDEAVLERAVLAANAAILDEERAHPAYAGMGTTATLFAYAEQDGQGHWAHVGDSRLYLLREGELRQITRDHSYVEELVANGTISLAEARVHPQKNLLTRAVGVDAGLQVDTGTLALQPQDIVLLTTDGLTNMVTDEEIRAVLLADAPDPAKLLIEQANAAGGRDNSTAAVVVFP